MPSDEEAYLIAILADQSGIDLAELTWWDPVEEDAEDAVNDGCWRARSYQYSWWRDPAPLQIDQCARDVGKTLGILARAYAFPFTHPGAEMVITAPELIHLEPVTAAIEQKFFSNRLGVEMMPKARGRITRRPFRMNFVTGSRIVGRIPQVSGRGVKGLHPVALEMDEACFPAGTMILTRRGQVPIEQVTVTDEVLTHRGRWRRVRAVIDAGVRDTVVLRGQGHPGLVVTPNHRFWASEITDWKDRRNRWGIKTRSPLGWRPASSMAGHLWSSPLTVPGVDPSFPVLPRAATGASYAIDTSTPAFLWLLGLYIAEGSTSSSYGTGGPIDRSTWSIHVKEVDTVLGYMEKAGLNARVQTVKSSVLCKNIVVGHGVLARWLSETCGRGCHFKKMPIGVMALSASDRQAVLDGLVYGDGRMDPDERYKPGRWKLATTSWRLAVGTRLLAQSLGAHVSIYPHDRNGTLPAKFIRGKLVRSGPSYEVVGNQAGQGLDEDGLRLTRVRAVTAGGARQVYDLQVADDHSFVADGVVVHNSDYPDAGWTELIATLRRGIKGAMWRAHGVTRGIRDKFYDFTQPSAENPWKVHRIVAMYREDWNDEERQRNITLYGSREAPDYRRNILGLHGDAQNALFVLARLMRLCDTSDTSKYNTDDYQRFWIRTEELEERAGPLQEDQAREACSMLAFNPLAYESYWCGMDVGFTVDPSEIVVAGEYHPSPAEIKADLAAHRGIPEEGMTRMRLIARIHLARVANPTQAAVIRHVIRHFKPKAFGMDRTGAGMGLWQDVLATDLEMAKVVRGYHFSEKVIVGIDGTVEVSDRDDVVKEAAMMGNVLEYATDKLRELVDSGRLFLPWDRDLLREFQGQTWSLSKAIMDAYGRRHRVFSTGNFHTLDAMRMLAMAHAQAPIEAFIADQKADHREPVLDQFM